MTDNLMPCPFCGAPAEERSPDYEIEVHCTRCAAKVEAAPEFWNRRVSPTGEDVERAELVQRLRIAACGVRLNNDERADIRRAADALSILSTRSKVEEGVTQEDRDRADDMLLRLKGYDILLYSRAACIADDGPVRQAFRAHRIAALKSRGDG